jgi:hypothetical protein
MERCIYKHVYNFLLKNSIITPHQSGGNLQVDRDKLNNRHNGGFKMEAPSLISRGFIKSGPVAFVVSKNHLVVKIGGILLKDYLVQVKVVQYPPYKQTMT